MKHKAQAIYEFLVKLFRRMPVGDVRELINTVVVGTRAYKATGLAEVGVDFIYYKIEFNPLHGPDDTVRFAINEHGGVSQKLDDKERDLAPFIDAMVRGFNLEGQFKSPISVKELEPFPENCNAFHHELTRMGCPVSGGWTAMYSEHHGLRHDGNLHPEPEIIVLVNERTGRRFELDMTDANKPLVKNENGPRAPAIKSSTKL